MAMRDKAGGASPLADAEAASQEKGLKHSHGFQPIPEATGWNQRCSKQGNLRWKMAASRLATAPHPR
jgi:hypothetical protein